MSDKTSSVTAWEALFRAQVSVLRQLNAEFPTADVALTVDIPEFPDPLKPTASRYAFLAIIDLVSSAVGTRLDPDARETLRRIKYTVLNHRKGKVLEPLGD